MANVSIDIELVNDNPHVLLVQSTTEYVEDGPPVVVSPNISIVDEDSGPAFFTLLTIQVMCKSSWLHIVRSTALHCGIGDINMCFLYSAPDADDALQMTPAAKTVVSMTMNLVLTRTGASCINVTGFASRDVYKMIAEGITYQKDSFLDQPLSLAATVCFILEDEMFTAMNCTDVTIVNVNDPPMVSLSAPLVEYSESAGQPVAIFPALTISDPDPGPSYIAWASIDFDPVVDANDTLDLALDVPGAPYLNITVEAHSILIRGLANSSVYEAVIASVTFVNLDPDLDLSNRIVTLVVSDGVDSSLPADVTVQILPFDDPPVCFFGPSEVGLHRLTGRCQGIYVSTELETQRCLRICSSQHC